MGLDLIEMATKAMTGLPVREYPPLTIQPDYVAVKVPQFSFSRLSGADPVMGVEMASTGEVACFGRTKYEAYLKGLISTGFKLPKKNILLSIGSFKDKVELLPSVDKLHKLGYKIFATAGTADFLEEHGIPVSFLEALQDEHQRQEYSLTHALANNLIDLYSELYEQGLSNTPYGCRLSNASRDECQECKDPDRSHCSCVRVQHQQGRLSDLQRGSNGAASAAATARIRQLVRSSEQFAFPTTRYPLRQAHLERRAPSSLHSGS